MTRRSILDIVAPPPTGKIAASPHGPGLGRVRPQRSPPRASPCRWRGLLLLAALQACSAAPEPPAQTRPSLAALRAARGQATGTAATPQRLVKTMIWRIDLPIDTSIEKAWNSLSTQSISADVEAMWRHNGFRIGILPRTARPAFLAALTPVYGEHARRVLGSGLPIRLAVAPRGHRTVTLLRPTPSGLPRPHVIEEGTTQLLMQVLVLDSGRRIVEITPHLHLPRRTFFRNPRAKVPASSGPPPLPLDLEGTWFRDLTLTVTLSRGESLVIGPQQRDTTPVAVEVKRDKSATRSRIGQHNAAEAEGQTADTPQQSLGRTILTARRLTHRVQSLYLVEQPTR